MISGKNNLNKSSQDLENNWVVIYNNDREIRVKK